MAIVYVTTGAWGTGTGTPNSAAQVDGNFYNVDQRIVDLNADLAEGKRIDSVTYTDTSMTFHFTDGTTQTIPLPVAVITYVGAVDEFDALYPRPDGLGSRRSACIRCWSITPRRHCLRCSIPTPPMAAAIRSIRSGCRSMT